MLPPKLIMVPIDFSDTSRAALDVAVDMASRFHAELLVVNVVPAVPDLPNSVSMLKEGAYDQSLVDGAGKHLAEIAAAIALKGVKARTEVGTANDVGMELIRIAGHSHADLIIISTHGMTGWRKIAFGSVAEKVVKEAELPVLVLRAKADDATREIKAASTSVSA